MGGRLAGVLYTTNTPAARALASSDATRGSIAVQFACALHGRVVISRTTSAVVLGSRVTGTGLGAGGSCSADAGAPHSARARPAASVRERV